MSWTYEQSSGKTFRPDNSLLATGYSGHGLGKNNPAMEEIHNVGPIPKGIYTILPAYTAVYEHKMPPVMHLMPDPSNKMYGRDGFLIHGDSIAAPGTASDGCIILSHDFRVEIDASDDKQLQVI